MKKITLKLGSDEKLVVEHSGVVCANCNNIIYSRARHDYHSCSCGDTHIDGGFDYMKIGFKKAPPDSVNLELIGVTKGDLYQDWNKRENKFGCLDPRKV